MDPEGLLERIKNDRAKRVCLRYDELREIGKHGHYETMMQVVREEIEREREACAKIVEEANTETSRKCIVEAIRARTKRQ